MTILPPLNCYAALTATCTPFTNNSTAPTVLLLDASDNLSTTARSLARAGWQVLAVDSGSAESVGIALDMLNLAPGQHQQSWLSPAALIITARHTPPEPACLTSSISLTKLVRWLAMLGLAPELMPYILYTDQPTLASTRSQLISLYPSNLPHAATFWAVVEETGDGQELLTALAAVTGIIFCAECHAQIPAQARALLATPYLYCAECAQKTAAVPYQALFPARLLARAAFAFTSDPTPPTITTFKPTCDLWDMTQD